MAIDFPANPTNGQVFSNYIYDSSITAWRNVNTDTGIGTLNAMGLKNVVPTSISVGSGSATVNANGLVTFSGASSISLNGVFTSTYADYEVIISGSLKSSVDNAAMQLRLRASSTDSSSNYYRNGIYQAGSGAASASYASNANVYSLIGLGTGLYNISKITISSPAVTIATKFIADSYSYTSANAGVTERSGGIHDLSNVYDGLTALAGTGTFQGTIQILGRTY